MEKFKLLVILTCLTGIPKGEAFSGNDLTSLKKIEHVEESKEDPSEGVVITDMLKEEENLENEGKKEEEKVKEEQKIWDQLDNEDRELRYNKLQLLLNKSTAQYLIKKMERQKQEDLKRTERRAKKMAKKILESTDTLQCDTPITVDRCPRNQQEWEIREKKINCQSNDSKKECLYHCVLNAEGTELFEVCAPPRKIYGWNCTEFNDGGNIIQDSFFSCKTFHVPCPMSYKSTNAYKYQECYDIVEKEREKRKNRTGKYDHKSSLHEMSLAVVGAVFTTLVVSFAILKVDKKSNSSKLYQMVIGTLREEKVCSYEGIEKQNNEKAPNFTGLKVAKWQPTLN